MMLVLFIIFLASAASYKPVPPIKCGLDEYAVPCKTICPPQNCDISYTQYLCDPNPKCIPGCDCIENHLRNDEKVCVFNESCPGLPDVSTSSPPNLDEDPSVSNCSATSSNKVASHMFEGNTNTSSNSSSNSSSSFESSYSFSNGIVGGSSNRECTRNSCTPTCSLPYSENCPKDSNPCNCPPGTIISEEGGKCVPKEECQKYANCMGDFNASYADCPFAYPSTCAKPEVEYLNTSCGNLACACNPGYLLSDINGTCIKPEDCPGGFACGQNETFVDCLNKCPNIYCPTNDSRENLVCEPEQRCPSGCNCQKKYKRKSMDEYICIHASDCPRINCTRPNEEWNFCPDPCFSDYCSARNNVTKPGDCSYSDQDCFPQCVCKQGFYRNGTNICVTAQECPIDNLAVKDKST